MTDKEKLNRARAEVERLKETKGFLPVEQRELTAAYKARGYQEACDDILSFIDSMQKEPEFKVGDKVRYKYNNICTKPRIIAKICGLSHYVDTDNHRMDMAYTDENFELVEESKKCMYSKDNYTDEDRKVLCDGCKEECKYSKSDGFTISLAECIHQAQGSVVDPMVFAELWKDELIKLAKSEEPVSEELKNIELLPELKESDGEKARKEIIAILKYKYEKYPKNPRYSNAPQLIAWLDKQGEPVSEDLGEAADNCYYRNHAHARESFIEGAKWDEQQKAKDAIDCEISEVEVDTCGCGLNSHTRLSIVVDDEELRNMGFKDGDKCKVVILKDTPEYIEGVKGSYTTTTK